MTTKNKILILVAAICLTVLSSPSYARAGGAGVGYGNRGTAGAPGVMVLVVRLFQVRQRQVDQVMVWVVRLFQVRQRQVDQVMVWVVRLFQVRQQRVDQVMAGRW
jgi:parvulin-like peptidyl-prolyl isomerase